MKKIAAFLLLPLGYLFLSAMGAFAGEQDFYLFNRTGFPIYGVYISHISSNNWEENILGNDVLPHGSHTLIRFPKSFGSSRYFDIKVKDRFGDGYIFERIDLIDSVGVALFNHNGRLVSYAITKKEFRRYLQNQ